MLSMHQRHAIAKRRMTSLGKFNSISCDDDDDDFKPMAKRQMTSLGKFNLIFIRANHPDMMMMTISNKWLNVERHPWENSDHLKLLADIFGSCEHLELNQTQI